MQKTALVTGVTGQDGSYLTDLLLKTQYKVYGLVRRSSTPNKQNINRYIDHPNFVPFYGDLTDVNSILTVIQDTQPDEIYNLGAQSDVRISFDVPVATGDTNALGVMRILEALQSLKVKSKFYQASTSELFGKVQETPQTETTPFYPRSPYGVAKLYAYWAVKNYRESYPDFFGCNGILFNHESPLRGENFVTRKITKAVGKRIAFKNVRHPPIELGNLDSKRDWGHSKDYVRGMWQMLQQDKPDDYILATGEAHSIRELVECAFNYTGEKVIWGGSGLDEKGYNDRGKVLVSINPDFYRPAEVDLLLGDPSKAEKELKWKREYNFTDTIEEMVQNDIDIYSGLKKNLL